jgi:MATE family multidrug resistance protein
VFSELRPLIKLAVPVILAEIGWMSMGLVDTLMVGPLGPAAIGAAGMGSGVFTAIAIFGMGLMLGLDPLVSQAHGGGRHDECRRWLYHGVWLALGMAPLILLASAGVYMTMRWWGLHPEIRPILQPYFQTLALGAFPLLFYSAFRRYLQGMHVVRPIMFALISANVINVLANWVLIYGHLGMPAMGVTGAGWATTVSRLWMAGFLFIAIRRVHRDRAGAAPRVAKTMEFARIRTLVALGFPAAAQVTLEVAVFATATALAGRLDPVSSGAHQIALNIAGAAFMVALGLASSGAVRVGHAVGAGDRSRAVRAGWTALGAGSVIMLALGLLLFLIPDVLVRAFTDDARVIRLGANLLMIAAAFQLFDGTQAVATGVLRGIGDTRTPMIANVVGHWVLGLPIAYVLCFRLDWGVAGLWVGLSAGLVFVSVVLAGVWWQRTAPLT